MKLPLPMLLRTYFIMEGFLRISARKASSSHLES